MTRLVCPRCGQVVETCATHPKATCCKNWRTGHPHPPTAMQPEPEEAKSK